MTFRWFGAVGADLAVFVLCVWLWEALRLPPPGATRLSIAVSVSAVIAAAFTMPLQHWAGRKELGELNGRAPVEPTAPDYARPQKFPRREVPDWPGAREPIASPPSFRYQPPDTAARYAPPGGVLRDPLAETSGILPGEYRFGWFSMPILLAVAIVAFVAPLETLWVELIGFVVTIVVSRIVGAALWIRLHGSEDFAAVAGRCFVRDVLGIAGLLIVVWCGLALGVYVLMPAVGFGSAHSYVQALEPGGPGNPFASIHQTAVFIHLFWLLPAVLTAAVVLMRPVGDLERPLVLPRIAKAINSRTLTVRLGLAGALMAVSGLLVVLTGGLSPTHLPSGAACAITPITCNAIKLASISGEHRAASPPRHNVPGSSKHQRST